MNQAFKEALEKKKIFHFLKAKNLVEKELRVAIDDLAEAKDRFKHERYKYATINAEDFIKRSKEILVQK
jgi:hypothetical protein